VQVAPKNVAVRSDFVDDVVAVVGLVGIPTVFSASRMPQIELCFTASSLCFSPTWSSRRHRCLIVRLCDGLSLFYVCLYRFEVFCKKLPFSCHSTGGRARAAAWGSLDPCVTMTAFLCADRS
jgi:hypothetical protein